MLHRTSQDFRRFFLLQFTREIIKNTKTEAIFELQERIKHQDKEIQNKIDKKEDDKKNVEKIKDILKKPINEIRTPKITHRQKRNPISNQRILRIPEPRLPPHLSYLKPYATNIKIDLGPLNPFFDDPAVNEIECRGENSDIIVRGRMGQKTTGITLNEKEINNIIDTISNSSRIPKEEGIFKAIIGKINFSAIISEHGSRFLIKKLNPPSFY